jgi:hypothetical protein
MILAICGILACGANPTEGNVLIVHDDPAPMAVLAKALEEKGGFAVTLAEQDELPDELSGYSAIFNFVHKPMTPRAERLCIEYARNGGRHILLHHAISSSKRNNPKLLAELRAAVPPGRKPDDGFYVERGKLTFANLAPDHFITTTGIRYPTTTKYPAADGKPVEREAFAFDDTEIFLNLKFELCPERTVLYGISFRDGDGVEFAQPAGGWVMRTGKGYSFYLQAGHFASDFSNPIYQQVLVNCVLWNP